MSPNRRAILTRCVAGRVLIPVPRRWGGLPGLPGEVGALLRREALYAAHLTKWRQRAEQGRRPKARYSLVRHVDDSRMPCINPGPNSRPDFEVCPGTGITTESLIAGNTTNSGSGCRFSATRHQLSTLINPETPVPYRLATKSVIHQDVARTLPIAAGNPEIFSQRDKGTKQIRPKLIRQSV